ncbi:protein FAR1-RELATED SEQUENCE 5-like [Carex rostrata]
MDFHVRKNYLNRSPIDGKITSRAFVCANKGYRKMDKRDDRTIQPRQETRSGCMVKLVRHINRKTDKYEVREFIDEHNHIFQMPQACYLLPCQCKVTEVAACDIDLADDSGIRPKETYVLMDNPSFQHEEQIDNQQEISNIFWADAQMVIDYVQFGDVVIFDTTHGINKEHRPSGVFLGLNHFRKSVIFGYVLLYDQTIESFEWVFKSFLKAYNNKNPKTIVTDQDAAMEITIANVMDIVEEFKICLFRLEEEAEFEKAFSDLESKQFEKVLADECEKEVASEYEYRKKIPRIKVKVLILLQVSERYYTLTFLEIFQTEYELALAAPVESLVTDNCKKFERWGVLCKHALKVLDTMNIKLLSEKYVLKRWTREVRDGVIYNRNGRAVSNPKLEETRRNRELCQKFTKIYAKAAGYEELYAFVDSALNNLEMQVDRRVLTVPNTNAGNFDISPKPYYMGNLPQKTVRLKKKIW